MSTTIPCILRELGDRNPDGFTKGDLLAAFIREGYSPDRAARRYKECVASNQIVPCPEETPGAEPTWITIYSRVHWKFYEPTLDEVHIVAVKIARDGSVIVL